MASHDATAAAADQVRRVVLSEHARRDVLRARAALERDPGNAKHARWLAKAESRLAAL